MARYLEVICLVDAIGANLRYIAADGVTTTDDRLEGAIIVGPAGTILGRFAGALIDPLRRHVCFLVVESRVGLAIRQYVLPLLTARFDRERNALLVDGEGGDLREVRVDTLERFSDDDLIAALFSTLAA